jgi:hypothetical protein
MRVYIINADRVIVVPQYPAELSNGEIAVASLEELRAARLTSKRLLALCNGLSGPERLSAIARGCLSAWPRTAPSFSTASDACTNAAARPRRKLNIADE